MKIAEAVAERERTESMIFPVCCRIAVGDDTAFLAGHHANFPLVYGIHNPVKRIRAIVNGRHLLSEFTTNRNRANGVCASYPAEELRALAEALEGKGEVVRPRRMGGDK